MGGAVSAGETNDELIDNLVEANYIRSKKVSILGCIFFIFFINQMLDQ